MEQRGNRRSWMITLGLVAALAGILARLYWIQMVTVRSFSQEEADLIARAQQQQSKEFVVDSGRGEILDRKGRSLTGEKEWRLIAFPLSPSQVKAHRERLRQVADVLDVSYGNLVEAVTALEQPEALRKPDGGEWILKERTAKKIRSIGVPGLFALQSDNRFSVDRDARQLIGWVERNPFLIREKYPDEWESGLYTAQSRVGVTGLEAAFEPLLRGGGDRSLTYTMDGKGRPLNGLHVQTKVVPTGGDLPYRLVTTLDKDVQRIAEEVLDDRKVVEGAVVIQDIASGDILAMASRPRPGEAKEDQNPWDNRAIMESTPGSIFKTVVAVAALDTGKVKPTDTFVCHGELGRYGMRDSNPKGHGKQTFAEAYANSCNVVFAQVAEKLGGEIIEKYAHKMGLGQDILWSGTFAKEKNFQQLPREQSGLIFAEGTSKKDGGAVAQTGIGQRDVKVTPVQAANMVTSLFHGGKTLNPRVVKEIRRHDGKVYHRFQPHALKMDKEIGDLSLKQVRMMMRQTVLEGTAQSLKNAAWAVGAKTGTAQVGPKKEVYNKWMVGYGPWERPRYSVAVLIRSVNDGDDPRSHRVFLQVMNRLAKLK